MPQIEAKIRIRAAVWPGKLEDMKDLLASCIMQEAAGIAGGLERSLALHRVIEYHGNYRLDCPDNTRDSLPAISLPVRYLESIIYDWGRTLSDYFSSGGMHIWITHDYLHRIYYPFEGNGFSKIAMASHEEFTSDIEIASYNPTDGILTKKYL